MTRDLAPAPGVTLVDGGADVAVYAGHADGVELCLFEAGDDEGTSERRVPLTERAHGWWFGFVPGVRAGQRYGIRADGAWDPEAGAAAQPRQAAPRPLREGPRGRRPMGSGGLRARRRRRLARRRRAALGPRQPVRRAAVRRRRRPLRLGGRRRPEPVAQRERDLRGARAQPERAAPRRPAGAARHVCRAGPPGVGRAPHPVGGDRGRAAAGARLHLTSRTSRAAG